jgi:hypothetical protein
MLLFKKPAKRQLTPATIRLPLGESPPMYQSDGKSSKSTSSQKQIENRRSNSISPYKGELNRTYSISPRKRRETNNSFTMHDLRESINEYYKPIPYKKPTIKWTTKIAMMTNHLKKTLKKKLLTKDKPINLDLGESPPNEQSFGGRKNIRKSNGGKIIAKPRRKPSNLKKNKK